MWKVISHDNRKKQVTINDTASFGTPTASSGERTLILPATPNTNGTYTVDTSSVNKLKALKNYNPFDGLDIDGISFDNMSPIAPNFNNDGKMVLRTGRIINIKGTPSRVSGFERVSDSPISGLQLLKVTLQEERQSGYEQGVQESKTEMNKRHKEEIASAMAEHNALKQSITMLEKTLATTRQTVQTGQAEFEVLLGQYQASRTEVLALQTEKQNIEDKNKEFEGKIGKNDRLIKQLVHRLKESHAVHKELVSRMEEMQSADTVVFKKEDAALGERAQKAQLASAAALDRLSQVQTENETLRSQLNELKIRKAELESSATNNQEKAAHLLSVVEQQRDEIKDLKEIENQYNQMNDLLKQQRKAMKQTARRHQQEQASATPAKLQPKSLNLSMGGATGLFEASANAPSVERSNDENASSDTGNEDDDDSSVDSNNSATRLADQSSGSRSFLFEAGQDADQLSDGELSDKPINGTKLDYEIGDDDDDDDDDHSHLNLDSSKFIS